MKRYYCTLMKIFRFTPCPHGACRELGWEKCDG